MKEQNQSYFFVTIALLALLSWSNLSQAQVIKNIVPFKGAIGGGVTTYHGDICPGVSCIHPNYDINVSLRYFIDKYFSFRPEAHFFKIKASDSNGPNTTRNLSFESTNLSMAFNLVYDFIPYNPRPDFRKVISPYIFLGVGGLFFNPKATYNGVSYELQPLATEGIEYSRFTAIVPGGIGIRVKVSNSVDLLLEYTYTQSLSDYLDDVSGTYIDNGQLIGISADLADRSSEGGFSPTRTDDNIHWEDGTTRGNPSTKDSYSMLTAKISFDLFKLDVICPEF